MGVVQRYMFGLVYFVRFLERKELQVDNLDGFNAVSNWYDRGKKAGFAKMAIEYDSETKTNNPVYLTEDMDEVDLARDYEREKLYREAHITCVIDLNRPLEGQYPVHEDQ